jgi:hypothetical protein
VDDASYFGTLLSYYLNFGYMNQSDILGKRPKNVCIQGFGGFGMGNPGFTYFMGLWTV